MKHLWALSIIMLSVFTLRAQLFEISNDPIFRNSQGNVYTNALAGGLNQPQFSNFDFNGDGKLDLFVFDRTGNKVLVFISETTPGTSGSAATIAYRYDPSYEQFFPEASEFMQLKDYDGDAKPDLWMYDGDSVVIYKNATVSLPQFDFIGDYNINTIYEDDEHSMWISTTNQGLIFITQDALAATTYNTDEELNSEVIRIENIGEDNKWIAYKNGNVCHFREGELTKFAVSPIGVIDKNWFLRDMLIVDDLIFIAVGNYELQVYQLNETAKQKPHLLKVFNFDQIKV